MELLRPTGHKLLASEALPERPRADEFDAALWKDTDDREEESLQLRTAMNPNPVRRMWV